MTKVSYILHLCIQLSVLLLMSSFQLKRAPRLANTPQLLTNNYLTTLHNYRNTNLKASLSPGDLELTLYDLQLQFSSILDRDLASLTPLSIAVLGGAGALSALSPCSLGILPISLSFLNQPVASSATVVSIKDRNNENVQDATNQKTLFFVLGSLVAFGGLGIVSSALGSLLNSNLEGYGTIKDVFLAVLYLIMGLSLSEVIPINFSTLFRLDSLNTKAKQYSADVQAFALGASTSLVGSSCTTPVLSSVLALLAARGDTSLGAAFLIIYGLGYSIPLLATKYLLREISLSKAIGGNVQWINSFFACLLLVYGGYLTTNIAFSVSG